MRKERSEHVSSWWLLGALVLAVLVPAFMTAVVVVLANDDGARRRLRHDYVLVSDHDRPAHPDAHAHVDRGRWRHRHVHARREGGRRHDPGPMHARSG